MKKKWRNALSSAGRMCGKMVIVYAKFSDYFFDEFYVSVC